MEISASLGCAQFSISQGSITATRAWDITISQVLCPGQGQGVEQMTLHCTALHCTALHCTANRTGEFLSPTKFKILKAIFG